MDAFGKFLDAEEEADELERILCLRAARQDSACRGHHQRVVFLGPGVLERLIHICFSWFA